MMMDCSPDGPEEIPEMTPQIRVDHETGMTWVQTPFTVDFVKHSVPDAALWQQELQQRLAKPRTLRKVVTEPPSFVSPLRNLAATASSSGFDSDPLIQMTQTRERKRKTMREMHNEGNGFGVPFTILISCPNHNWKFCVRTGVNIGSEKDPSRSLPRYHLKTDVVGFEKYFFISGFGIGRPVDDLGQSAPASKRKFLMRRETAM
eukprot:GEMP01038355.1.p1 GENE.GEMP01038355.1~~GEMP01038355.1.p1  ORF type:complete len:204 (+),score=31.97 GEMP01038355.1:81-692(+)